MDSFTDTNKIMVMNIEEHSPNTTDRQYQLFKALLVKGSDVSGYTYDEFENELINNFAPFKYEKSILGDVLKKRKQVHDMNSKEFNIFIEQCLVFCSEFYGFNF